MKKKIGIGLGIAIGISLFLPFFASAQVPFGGIVTAEYPCDSGLLIYVRETVSVVPLVFTVVPFMWLWGELPYLEHVPPHPAQELLGKALPTPVPCFVGFYPIGAGLPIEFHGDSL